MNPAIIPEHLQGLALAMALGLLVGVQRGWSLRDQPPGSRFAGIRTYGLLGLAGGMAGVLQAHVPGAALAVMAAACALVVLGYYRMRGLISGTASMAGLLTLACAFVASAGEPVLGAGAAVAMVLLLAWREPLHGWVSRLNETEVLAIARFALIALVILPLLPDRAMGPWQVWNPHDLWLVVVLVSGLSFAGYFAARALGATRGLMTIAAAGAVVSSTAVTAAMSTRLRRDEGTPALAHAGIAIASLFMYLRVIGLVALLTPFALPGLLVLIGPAALASLAAFIWAMMVVRRSPDDAPGDLALRNPFDIRPALILAALVMVASLAAHWVMFHFGDRGLAVVLAISGSVDVDSAIITMGGLPAGAIDPAIAGLVLAIPVTLNTLFKSGITLSLAGWRRGWPGAMVLWASALASGAAYGVAG